MNRFQIDNTSASEPTVTTAMNPQVHTEAVLPMLPSILKALNDNPVGALVLVTLTALALAGYAIYVIHAIHKRK